MKCWKCEQTIFQDVTAFGQVRCRACGNKYNTDIGEICQTPEGLKFIRERLQ